MDLIVTAPSVVYKIILNGPAREEVLIDTPAKLPDPSTFQEILEPYVRLEMITPTGTIPFLYTYTSLNDVVHYVLRKRIYGSTNGPRSDEARHLS